MARQGLGLQWQAKGEEQKRAENPAHGWASNQSPPVHHVGRPRVIDPKTTVRLQVRIDRAIVEDLRIQASRKHLSLSQYVEAVLALGKLQK